MIRRNIGILLLVLLCACRLDPEPREEDDPLFFFLKRLDVAERINGLAYDEARKLVLAAGWAPMQSHVESDERLSHGSARDFWNRGYIEIEECGGGQQTFCNFIFRDSLGNKLFVTTAGPGRPDQTMLAAVTYTQVVSDYQPVNSQ